MKKAIKLLVLTSTLAIGCFAVSLSKKDGRIFSAKGEESGVDYRQFYQYDPGVINATNDFNLETKGLDAGKQGILFSSVNTGLDAEGASFSYKSILNGNFSLDFRVFSEKSYQPADPSYTVTPYASDVWMARINEQCRDDFNPYLDLKELAITFTSRLDANKWFTVFLRGGHQDARADTVSASVLLSTDNPGIEWNSRGYGLFYGGYVVDMWQIGRFTCLGGGAFSNHVLYGETTSINLSFNLEMMTVGATAGGEFQNIRYMSDNAGLNNNGFSEAFGTLTSEDFAGGYNVSFAFTDVTPDNYIVNYSESYFKNCEQGYADLTEEYLRYANMVIYSMNGATYTKSIGTVETITAPVVADGTTLDADRFGDDKKAYLLGSEKTGDEAEGTNFSINKVFTGLDPLTIDFRVFSEKSYRPKNPEATTTHDYCWDIKNHFVQAVDLYANDKFNPYLDLKEVAFTFTSVSNPSKWVKVFIRGGAAERADLSTARILTSADNTFAVGIAPPDGIGIPYSQKLWGYGLQCDATWPYLGWLECNGGRYTELTSGFSNITVAGTNKPTSLTFYPDSLFIYGDAGHNRLIRSCETNEGLNESGYGYESLASSYFHNGYTLNIEFTDVTSNVSIGEDITGQYSCRSDLAYSDTHNQYQTFTEAYERHPNMVLYSLKCGENEIDLTNSFINRRDVICAADFSTAMVEGETLDVTPQIIDIIDGELAYNGTITWMNTATEETGTLTSNEQGRYLFTPSAAGKYKLSYSPSSYASYNPTCAFAVYIDVGENVKIIYLDENGDEITRKGYAANSKITFDNYTPDDEGKVFIGWEFDDGIYPAGYETYIKSEITLKAVVIDFALSGGREIRYTHSVSYKYGMTQKVMVDQAKLNQLINDGYVRKTYGYIIPLDMVEGELTPSAEGLNIPITFSEGTSTFGIANIKGHNFNRDFAFMSYFSFRFSDGSSKIVKTAFDESRDVTNIYELANATYNDALTETEKEVLRYYINGVISFTQTASTITCADSRVTVNEARFIDSEYYEVTITVNDELYKYLKAYPVGSTISLYVNNIRKPGNITAANGQTLTIRYDA